MHDIDRSWNELGQGEMDSGEMEFGFGETEFDEMSSPFSEMQEMDLASELLSISSEEELNYFLGNLIKKAGKAVGKFVSSPTGKALGGILKQAAKKALPVVGSAIGGYFGGSSGANIGGKLASSAGKAFGLEMEGMDQEDQEFETARRFVKMSGAAVSKAVQSPGIDPRQAVSQAAQRYLPGLSGRGNGQQQYPGGGRSGRWYRRGKKIILVGV